MRDFTCPNCGQRLAFENSLCLSCGSALGFGSKTLDFEILDADGTSSGSGQVAKMCGNVGRIGCNWLAATDEPSGLCFSCRLTRTVPARTDTEATVEFAEAETAKRRLLVGLLELHLPIIGRDADPERGLCFDLLSSARTQVMTGHDDGVITLDLAESNDVHREQLRVSMGEPYRTLLGHFRHEIGHYYYMVLAESGPVRAEFENLFGDPDLDYQKALDRHYSQGAPAGWETNYVSSYATMHPAEDWAETFAHYLHIRDTIDTAAAFGFAPSGAALDRRMPGDAGFDRIIELWLPLSWSLNMINRSMGHRDLYPFVLAGPMLDKMRLVHRLVTEQADQKAAQ